MSDARTGGLTAWSPRAVPGPGIELTPAQELAIAFRHLDDVGWCENMTGHITLQQGDVVAIRTGVLLDRAGGALKRMLPTFRLGRAYVDVANRDALYERMEPSA